METPYSIDVPTKKNLSLPKISIDPSEFSLDIEAYKKNSLKLMRGILLIGLESAEIKLMKIRRPVRENTSKDIM